MQSSMFNVRVPLEGSGDVFLMNTFTDAQLIVSRDVVDLIDRVHLADDFSPVERETIEQLTEHGFLVRDRQGERDDLRAFFRDVREGTDTLKVTVLTTLQCNFACDYCIQGDHGDYNTTAAKMSPEMAARVCAWPYIASEACASEKMCGLAIKLLSKRDIRVLSPLEIAPLLGFAPRSSRIFRSCGE